MTAKSGQQSNWPDAPAAYVSQSLDPLDPNQPVVLIKPIAEEEQTPFFSSTNPVELVKGAIANVALRESATGFPSLKHAKDAPDPRRLEWELGYLMADIVSAVAPAMLQCLNSRERLVRVETEAVDLLVQLHLIWYASGFGCINCEGGRAAREPYFYGEHVGGPRVSFAEAAKHYGMEVLRDRYPDVSDVVLRALLSWPLDLLRGLLDRLLPRDAALKAFGVG